MKIKIIHSSSFKLYLEPYHRKLRNEFPFERKKINNNEIIHNDEDLILLNRITNIELAKSKHEIRFKVFYSQNSIGTEFIIVD